MKITFSNLGAIKKTTLDLRPLTVIIGPNNSNKTYIAYSIYGLLNQLSKVTTSSLLTSIGFELADKNSSKDINKLYEVSDNGIYSLKIDSNLLRIFREDCLALTDIFTQQLELFFQDSSKNLFKKTSFEVKFAESKVKMCLEKLIASETHEYQSDINFRLDKNILYAEFVGGDIINKPLMPNLVAGSVGFGLKTLIYPKPFLLPAERNALIITYKILESRRYNLLKNASRASFANNLTIKPPPVFYGGEINPLQTQNIRYPQPIEDFLDFLTDLEIENELDKKGKFTEFAQIIEKNIQRNNKTNYVTTVVGGKEIRINVKKGLDIDLYNASSSIKQLAPLLLYLRYRAKENDLLIIDEPEMNLHPESQAKLLEVLGMLVNAGVNVLLTTHSPYFMSHLNNLISGDMTDEKIREKQAKSLYLEDARAFLSPDDVSAYEMKKDRLGNQKLHDLKDKDYGIRWDTLSDVSADIQQKFFEIYEKAKETSKGKEN